MRGIPFHRLGDLKHKSYLFRDPEKYTYAETFEKEYIDFNQKLLRKKNMNMKVTFHDLEIMIYHL